MNVRWSVWKENGHVHTHMIIGSVKKSRCKHQQVSSLFVILSKSRYWYLYVLLSFSDGGFKVILHIAHVIVLHTHTHTLVWCAVLFCFVFVKRCFIQKYILAFLGTDVISFHIHSYTVKQWSKGEKRSFVMFVFCIWSCLCSVTL